ncbi:venom C-type lectin mannose binding isoform 2 variant 1, partial [Aphelenchoides avenae]
LIPQNAGNTSKVWIGLTDPTQDGDHTKTSSCWQWLDGTPFGYVNFAPQEPNNFVAPNTEWCVDVFLAPSGFPVGTWNDENCDAGYLNPALCSIRANNVNSAILQLDVDVGINKHGLLQIGASV